MRVCGDVQRGPIGPLCTSFVRISSMVISPVPSDAGRPGKGREDGNAMLSPQLSGLLRLRRSEGKRPSVMLPQLIAHLTPEASGTGVVVAAHVHSVGGNGLFDIMD